MKNPKVNIYDAERKFEEYVEQAINDEYIKKPIAWALYQTWKWANFNEKEREANANKGVLSQINEKQDSLKATCKAWDEAIEKNGYVN